MHGRLGMHGGGMSGGGGMHSRGPCMVGGMHSRGACMQKRWPLKWVVHIQIFRNSIDFNAILWYQIYPFETTSSSQEFPITLK